MLGKLVAMTFVIGFSCFAALGISCALTPYEDFYLHEKILGGITIASIVGEIIYLCVYIMARP
jgi:hypothetical protein